MTKPKEIDKYNIDERIRKFNPKKRILTGRSYLFIKRMFDMTAVLLASPFWLPVLVLVGVLVWIDSPGAPVMFFQYRTGRSGKRFKMYKFRSMVPNAEELKQKYMHLNELQWPDFKITNDPRVTRVGRIYERPAWMNCPN